MTRVCKYVTLMQHSVEITTKGLRLEGEYSIVYYPFDLLHLVGLRLLRVPRISERRSPETNPLCIIKPRICIARKRNKHA